MERHFLKTGKGIIVCSRKHLHGQLTGCLGGFSLFFTDNGKKALDMFTDSPPSLLVLENDLPDMNGLSLLKIVKMSHPQVIIIFLYDSHNPTLAIDAFRYGARDCFAKPLDHNALKEKILLLINVLKDCPPMKGNIFLDSHAQFDFHEQRSLQNLLSGRKEGVFQAKRFLDKNFHHEITLEQVAETACMSKYHFSRMFKNRIGISWSKYLRRLRIEKAKQLLAESDLSVTQVCEEVGYNDLTHFTRIFKRNVDVTPRVYRKEVRD